MAPFSWPMLPENSALRFQGRFGGKPSRSPEPPSIYAVDDVPHLTDLYRTLLEMAGYTVRTFNDRTKAIAGLTVDEKKPDLLITDYRCISMPADQFICACRRVHPKIRILMASGFDPREMRFFRARPDRFIQKPFTPEEFQREIRAVLGE